MNDTIYRQAAIDAVSDACLELRGVFGRCEDALNALPSAQPDITKCGKCRHAKERGCALYCALWESCMPHWGYCFRAERREE